MQTGSFNLPFGITIYIGLLFISNVVKAQDWLGYSGLFGGFNGYATQGPPPVWDGGHFGSQNQQGVIDYHNQASFIHPQDQVGMNQLAPNNQNTVPLDPLNQGVNQGVVDQQVLNQGHFDIHGGLNRQPQYQQWQEGIQGIQQTSGYPTGMILSSANNAPPQTPEVLPSSPPTDPINTSAAPPQEQWSSHVHTPNQQASVDQNTWQEATPGPPPLDKLHGSQQQWVSDLQSMPDPNQNPSLLADQADFTQNANFHHQGLTPTQNQDNIQAPTQDHTSASASHTATSTAQIAPNSVQQYLMPAGGQVMHSWPVVPVGTYATHPEAKAEWIRYMREAALRFYGRYPTYQQPTWNNIPPHHMLPAGTSVHPVQSKNLIGGITSTNSNLSTEAIQSSQQHMVQSPETSLDKQLSFNMARGRVPNQPQSDQSYTPQTTGQAGHLDIYEVTTTPGIQSTTEVTTPSVTDKPVTTVSVHETSTTDQQLSNLTPHKNMTNAELHKIIRILIIPRKLSKLAKAKQARQMTTSKPPYQAAVKSRPTRMSVYQSGPQRRPVSEMHIKMIHFAPASGIPGHSNVHSRINNMPHQPMSEIHVKLVNYDQRIVDTFNSHVSSPHARIVQPKWISTNANVHPHQIHQATTRESLGNNKPKLFVTQHISTRGPLKVPSPSQDTQRSQEDVRNHQKAVVRHTQMLHHVMSSLKKEMNLFQGSVRQSRNTAAAAVALDAIPNASKSETPYPKQIHVSISTKSAIPKADTPKHSNFPKHAGTISLPGLSSLIAYAQNKTKITVPKFDNAKVSTTTISTSTTTTISLSTTASPPLLLNSQGLHLPPVPDLFSDLNINADVTSVTSPAFVTSSPTPGIHMDRSTFPTASKIKTSVIYNIENEKQSALKPTAKELKIKSIFPATLIGESKTGKPHSQLHDAASYKFTNAEVSNIKLSAFYTIENKEINQSNIAASSIIPEYLTLKEGNPTLLSDVATTLAPHYEPSAATTAIQNVPLSGSGISVTTEVAPEVIQDITNAEFNNKLAEQLGKLDHLNHRQRLINQQHKLKEQHERLKKQKEVLQQQLRTLRKLRGAQSGPSLPVPEGPADLAALFSSLKLSF